MTMTLDNDAGIDTTDMTSSGLANEIAEMLARQGFDVRGPDSEDSGRLTITNAPKGHCEIDVYDNGWVTCDYYPRTGENADPADISRAVARLLAVSQDKPAGDHVDTHPESTLKGAVACAMKARGMMTELRLSADEVTYNVYADIAITNPGQPGRGIVAITDEGNLWWECHADELTGRAREIAMTLTDMLTPPISGAGEAPPNGHRPVV
jgi:hypothetical protein